MVEPDVVPQEKFDTKPWTNDELVLLHAMVRDYDRARWLRGQMKWWAIWVLGLPTAVVTVWQAIDTILHKLGIR